MDVDTNMTMEEKTMLYHASPVKGIVRLEPRISNHGIPLIYFSRKRENVLVYLCNAVEKYCKESGFEWHDKWSKWGPYGFNKDGILRLEEYYPNAMEETYKGVSAYIYCVDENPDSKDLTGIPFAVTMDHPVDVAGCEFVPDAYAAILEAEAAGKLLIRRYEDMSKAEHAWIEKTILEEYKTGQEDYRFFLKGKFPDIILPFEEE